MHSFPVSFSRTVGIICMPNGPIDEKNQSRAQSEVDMCSRCALLLVWGESINSGERVYLSQWACRDGFPWRVLPWWQRDASHALSGVCGSICSHLRRRRLLHETHGNLHLFKPTVSYRLFAPKMSWNSFGDSGKTSPRAGINIQLSRAWWRILRESLYKRTDGYLGPKQLKVQRLMPRRMFLLPSKQKQVLLTFSFCPNNNNRKIENPFEMMRVWGAPHYGWCHPST